MSVSPRLHIPYISLTPVEAACVDDYSGLTPTEAAHVRNHLYLCDESQTELGNGYAETTTLIKTGFRSDIGEYYTYTELHTLFQALNNTNQAYFMQLVAGSFNAVFCIETIYGNLSGADRTTFKTDMSLFLGDLSGIEAGYNGLSSLDKSSFANAEHLYQETLDAAKMLYWALNPTDREPLAAHCYTNLSLGDKTIFQGDFFLYPATLVGGKALFDALTMISSDKLNLTKYDYEGLGTVEQTNFRTAELLMLVTEAQTESWCETCYSLLSPTDKATFRFVEGLMTADLTGVEAGYTGLSAPDKALFLDYIHADPETLAGIIHGYNYLSASDQLLFMRTVLTQMEIRTKSDFWDLQF